MKIRMNLDSLTDLVSNSIGMLILFSLITLTQNEQQVYKIEVPVEHMTKLAPKFFICRHNKIIPLELGWLFQRSMAHIAQIQDENWFDLGIGNLKGRIPLRKGLVIDSPDTSSWEDGELIEHPRSQIHKALSEIDPNINFAFFFVYDDPQNDKYAGSGFEAYRKARAFLQEHGVKSGWVPVSKNNPPHICFWSDVLECRFRPSHL